MEDRFYFSRQHSTPHPINHSDLKCPCRLRCRRCWLLLLGLNRVGVEDTALKTRAPCAREVKPRGSRDDMVVQAPSMLAQSLLEESGFILKIYSLPRKINGSSIRSAAMRRAVSTGRTKISLFTPLQGKVLFPGRASSHLENLEKKYIDTKRKSRGHGDS